MQSPRSNPLQVANPIRRITTLLFRDCPSWGSGIRGARERKAGECSGSQHDFCNQLIGRALLDARKLTPRFSSQSAAAHRRPRARCALVVSYANSVSSTRSTTKSSSGFGAEHRSVNDADFARNARFDDCARFRSFKKQWLRQRMLTFKHALPTQTRRKQKSSPHA
jgi:hypothetical protein